MSLAVIIIGKQDFSISAINSGRPPLSEVVIPSASSIRIIFPGLNKLFWSVAGLTVCSSFNLFLKSEAFSSRISRLFSRAAARTNDVFPVPAGPYKISAFLFGNSFRKSFRGFNFI